MSKYGPLTFGQIICSFVMGGIGLACTVIGIGTIDLTPAFSIPLGIVGIAQLALAVFMYRRSVGFRSDL